MSKAKTTNPLQMPLQKLLAHAERIQSIPGFDSETLRKGIEDGRKALAVKTKTKP